MHLEGDLRMLPISTKVPLAHEQSCDEPSLDIGDLPLGILAHRPIVSPGRKT
jgi:hypothetical protein